MAYREVAMWEIFDVLRRLQGGDTNSAVVRTTGRGRSTVRRYLAVAAEFGLEAGQRRTDGGTGGRDRPAGSGLVSRQSRPRPKEGRSEPDRANP